MIIDGHSDIFTDVTIRRLQGETQVIKNRHIERLRKGGVDGSIFVIWIDPPYDNDPPKRLKQILECSAAEMAECDVAVICKTRKEVEEAYAAGKFAIVIGLEGLSGIGEDIDMIDQLYDFGARHAMLTWNEQNALGTGVQGDPTRGLTELGKKAARKIQDKNMILDVSHANEKTFWDIISLANAPIIASHSNAYALSCAARNLKDEQLRAIRDLDGVVGLNSFNLFVSQDIKDQDLDHLTQHASYIADKIGVEHLAFGFDFFEFLGTDSMSSYSDQDTSYTRGFEDCTKIPLLIEKMKAAGFTESDMELVCYKNWMRMLDRI